VSEKPNVLEVRSAFYNEAQRESVQKPFSKTILPFTGTTQSIKIKIICDLMAL
jgi:hypothetical protein